MSTVTEEDIGREILEMSTVTEEGVMDVKNNACELLLQHRVEHKFKSKKVETVLNRLHVAEPVARDNKARPAFVPEAALRRQREKLEAKMEDGEDEEEEARERAGFYDSDESEVDEAYEEIKDLATKIRRKKGEMKADQWIDQTKKSTLTRVSAAKKRERSVAKLKAEFESPGVTGLAEKDEDAHFTRARSASRGPKAKRAKLSGVDPHATKGAVDRSKSGIRGEDAAKLNTLKKKRDKKAFASVGKAGESDRRIQEKKPKHLYSGKRGMGKTDRR